MTFLQEQGIERISDVSEDTFTDFILWLKERHDNAITINTYLRNTRAFFYFCMKKEYMPKFVVTLLKQEEKVMTTYTDQDILKLVRKPNLKTCLFSEHRDWVAIQFFIETGCRIRTLVNIKVADLDVENRKVIFRETKNRTEQDMPLSRRLVQVLPDYIDLWNSQPEGYLFPNAQGETTSEDSVKASITDYNIRRDVVVTSVHAFRHSFAPTHFSNLAAGGQTATRQPCPSPWNGVNRETVKDRPGVKSALCFADGGLKLFLPQPQKNID